MEIDITPVIRQSAVMATLQSKLTSQSQISIPAPVSQERVITRVTKCSTQDIHSALFPESKTTESQVKSMSDLKEGIREKMRRRYAHD
jgi:hypothetical protein